EVNKRVQVAIISTGNELVEPGFGVELKGGQIFNSNQPMLAALLSKLGCDIVRSHIIEDTFAATHMALKSKADSVDLIISSGGVSVGEADHVKAAVEDLGELQMWKVNMKPGKPVVYGHVENTPFLGLPGNPVSALVTFLLFAVPLIQKLQGRNVKAPLSFFVPALFTITSPRSRPEYMRVNIGERGAEKFVNQSSGVLRSVAWANALALVPAEKCLNEGDLIEVFPLELLTE
ncbi:MAG: molybdopterin molybdotransferase, partial [Lentisphaeria bacterium]